MENFELKPIPEIKKQEGAKIQTNGTKVMLNVRIEKSLNDLIGDFAYQERYTKREVITQALQEFLANKTIKIKSEQRK
jgi:hypothetical protein